MFCVKCGKEIKDTNKFCIYCGAPVEQLIIAEEFAEDNDSVVSNIDKPNTEFSDEKSRSEKPIDIATKIWTPEENNPFEEPTKIWNNSSDKDNEIEIESKEDHDDIIEDITTNGIQANDGTNEETEFFAEAQVNTSVPVENSVVKESYYYENEINGEEYKKQGGTGGLKVLLFILIVVLILALIGGVGFFVYNFILNPNNGNEDTITEEVSEKSDDVDYKEIVSKGEEKSESSLDNSSGKTSDDSKSVIEKEETDNYEKEESLKRNNAENEFNSYDYNEEEETEETDYTEDNSIHDYDYIIADLSWKKAYKDCIKRGGHLLHINSDEEYEKIQEDLDNEKYQGINFYIGGRRDSDTEEYYWINNDGDYIGDKLNGKNMEKYWLKGEPSYEGDGEQELFMDILYKKSDGKWYWNDVPNDMVFLYESFKGKVGYICEYE